MKVKLCHAAVPLVAVLLTLGGCAQATRNAATTEEGAANMPEKLDPCPATPNCVCSEYPDDSHAVPPLAFDGDAESAWSTLREVVNALPRTQVVASDADYLKAETKTALLRFVDDLEFRLDREAGVIHVRSASRVGFSDLGANGKRVTGLRAKFDAALD